MNLRACVIRLFKAVKFLDGVHHPARGTLLSISCLVVGGAGMLPLPLPEPFRSRR